MVILEDGLNSGGRWMEMTEPHDRLDRKRANAGILNRSVAAGVATSPAGRSRASRQFLNWAVTQERKIFMATSASIATNYPPRKGMNAFIRLGRVAPNHFTARGLQQDHVSMKLQKVLLASRKGADIDHSVGVDAHSFQ